MGLFGIIKNFFEGETFRSLTAPQEKAFVDALVYAKVADGDIQGEETEEFKNSLKPLRWKSQEPLSAYVQESVARAEALVASSGDVRAYVADISARLEEDWAREETYYLAARLTASDQGLDYRETAFLKVMVDEFNIPEARLSKISDQLIRETSF